MKRNISITAVLLSLIVGVVSSCDSKRQPGKIYMPDMAYSRAYESYAEHDSTFTTAINDRGGKLIFYNNIPAAGTIKRGELFPYTLPNTPEGYAQSATVKNPVDSLSAADMAEAGRLFNINCAICHGEKAAGNGPISTSGKIGGIANLTLPAYAAMTDGTMFHSITYGKNLMGSYASQVDRKQRWMIIKYIRTLQPNAAGAAPTATADSTIAKK